MGNEKSVFRNATIQTQPFHTCRHYSMHECTHLGRHYTLFELKDKVDPNKLKNWKAIRHPHCLRFFESTELKNRTCIFTEPVRPLSELHTSLTSDEIICGLSQVCESLSFLHERCSLGHTLLTLDAIFVSTSNHSWKLGLLQHVSPASNANQVHVPDMQSLAFLIRQLLTDRSTCTLPTFLDRLEQTKAPENASISKASELLLDPLFRHCDYLQIVHFIEHFASFDEPTVDQFFESIVARLRSLPPEVLSQKLIPLLLTSRFVMLHPTADQKLLPYLFACTYTTNVDEPLLNAKQFKHCIVPLICKLFCVRKVQIRLILLRYLPSYARHMSSEIITGQLLPQILLGEKDENDELVAATFVAISELVRIFGAATILGERKRLFSKIIPKANRSATDDTLMHEPSLSRSQSSCAGDSATDSSVTLDDISIDKLNEMNESSTKAEIEKVKEHGRPNESCNNSLQKQSTKTIRMMSLVRDIKPTSLSSLSASSGTTAALSTVPSTNGTKTLTTESRSKQVNKINSVDLESDIKSLKIEPKMDEIDQLFIDMKPKVKFKQSHHFVPKVPDSKLNAKFSVEHSIQDDDSGAGWAIEEENNDDDVDVENDDLFPISNGICYEVLGEDGNIAVN